MTPYLIKCYIFPITKRCHFQCGEKLVDGPDTAFVNTENTILLRQLNMFSHPKNIVLLPPYDIIYPLWFFPFTFMKMTYPARSSRTHRCQSWKNWVYYILLLPGTQFQKEGLFRRSKKTSTCNMMAMLENFLYPLWPLSSTISQVNMINTSTSQALLHKLSKISNKNLLTSSWRFKNQLDIP